jgi:hypothetical protein
MNQRLCGNPLPSKSQEADRSLYECCLTDLQGEVLRAAELAAKVGTRLTGFCSPEKDSEPGPGHPEPDLPPSIMRIREQMLSLRNANERLESTLNRLHL